MIRFKTFRYSLGILIIGAALCGFGQRAIAQIVEIPDPNLERAIRAELGVSSGSAGDPAGHATIRHTYC